MGDIVANTWVGAAAQIVYLLAGWQRRKANYCLKEIGLKIFNEKNDLDENFW